MKNRLITILGVSLSLLGQIRLCANTVTVSNGLDANIEAVADLSVTGSVSLTQSGTTTPFTVFTGSDTVQYKARTTSSGGGTITLRAMSDFAAGGPSISRGDLSYTCGSADLGTACSSTTVGTSATTVVTLPQSACTGGGGSCSSPNPNAVAVNFTLADDPSDQTGSYTAMIQFTISAT